MCRSRFTPPFARMAMAAPEAEESSIESLESTRRELLETRALAQRACGSVRASVTLARERLDALQTAMQAKVAELETVSTRTQAALEAEMMTTRHGAGVRMLRQVLLWAEVKSTWTKQLPLALPLP